MSEDSTREPVSSEDAFRFAEDAKLHKLIPDPTEPGIKDVFPTHEEAEATKQIVDALPESCPGASLDKTRLELLARIVNERTYQEQKWGDEFDRKNTANDWVTYIMRYAAKGAEFNVTRAEFQTAMIKVATLALAAAEATKRLSGPAPRHYDSEED